MLFRTALATGLFTGFTATLITSIFMILLKARGKQILDLHLFFGRALFGKKYNKNFVTSFVLIFHLIMGSLLGMLYMQVFVPGLLSGIIFALVIWFFMMLVLFPLFQQGVFAMKLDKKRKKKRKIRAWQLTLIFHLIFGIVLGFFSAL